MILPRSLLFWCMFTSTILSQPTTSLIPTTHELSERQTALNAFLTILAKNAPPIAGTLQLVGGAVMAYNKLIAGLTGVKTTYNELGTGCTAYTLIFAKGTSETGNVGALVGPPFILALKDQLGAGALKVQGIAYDATYEGYFAGGDANGSDLLAKTISTALSICLETKLIVGGYSQGAQLVHNGIGMLPSPTAEAIHAVVLFGDPDDNQALPHVDSSRVRTFCYATDNICENGDLVLPSHLTYGNQAMAAAQFVASKS